MHHLSDATMVSNISSISDIEDQYDIENDLNSDFVISLNQKRWAKKVSNQSQS